MALPLGKLAILIGAGLVGSVLAKEGRLPGVSDLFSGALKVMRQVGQNDKTTSSAKPRNDSLMAQVNSLREELQLLASSRPVTIVTSASSGSSKYGIIIIVVVVGYGYVWWKGWKLPDLMFATKRSLSDATNAVAKQLDNVHASVSATKRHLSSRIDRVDCSLDECTELTAATKEEVTALRGDTLMIKMDVQSVHHAVFSLESKLSRIEGKQDDTNYGVAKLVNKAISMENRISMEQNQALPASSSRPALEMAQMTSTDRASSMPPVKIEELSSSPPASSGPPKVRRLQSDVSGSGLKALHMDSDVVQALSSPRVSNVAQATEEGNSGNRLLRMVSGVSLFRSLGR